jgi:hypothetical protein
MSPDDKAEFEAFREWKRNRTPADATKLPEPVDLAPQLAERAAQLKALVDGVNVVVGVLNGTVQQANNQFWLDVIATHNVDTGAYDWTVDSGTIVPKPKEPALAGQPAA